MACICSKDLYATLMSHLWLSVFLGRRRRPYIVFRFRFCMASCSYISVTKWRRSGFLEFTKLLLALSSFAQPFDRMRSIQEYSFIILSHRQACAGRLREETVGKRRGPVTKWPPWSLLFTRLEIVFVIISSFTKRTKVVHE